MTPQQQAGFKQEFFGEHLEEYFRWLRDLLMRFPGARLAFATPALHSMVHQVLLDKLQLAFAEVYPNKSAAWIAADPEIHEVINGLIERVYQHLQETA